MLVAQLWQIINDTDTPGINWIEWEPRCSGSETTTWLGYMGWKNIALVSIDVAKMNT